MLLREADADETMLHDPSAPWPSVDRGLPVVHSCVLADASCRCLSACDPGYRAPAENHVVRLSVCSATL